PGEPVGTGGADPVRPRAVRRSRQRAYGRRLLHPRARARTAGNRRTRRATAGGAGGSCAALTGAVGTRRGPLPGSVARRAKPRPRPWQRNGRRISGRARPQPRSRRNRAIDTPVGAGTYSWATSTKPRVTAISRGVRLS